MVNILMLNKNNEELEVAPEHFQKAISSGLEPAFEMKDTKGELQVVRKTDFEAAQKAGLKMAHEYDAMQPKKGEFGDISKTESAVRGFSNLATGGHADELQAAIREPLGALKAIGNKLGGNFDASDYETKRDIYRQVDDEAYDQNPGSYIAGGAAGVVPQMAAAIPGGLMRGLGVAAAEGALQGHGGGTDFSNEEEKTLQNTLVGGGLGAAGGAAGQLLAKGASKVPTVARSAAEAIKEPRATIASAMQHARKETAEDPALVKAVTYPLNLAKGVATTAVREAEGGKQIKSLAQEARTLLENAQVVGSGKNLNSLSDEDAIILALNQPGANPVKEYIAATASTKMGRLQADEVKKVLELGPEGFNEALDFSKRAQSQELLPDIEAVRKGLKTDKGSAFGSLKEAAKGEFDKKEAFGVVGDLQSSLADMANSRSISSTSKNAIKDALDAIIKGKALRRYGLNPEMKNKGLGIVEGQEAFNRLHAGRRIIDDVLTGMDTTSPEYLPLKEARDSIDARIKSTPSMQKADEIYSRGLDLERDLFKPFMRKIDKGKYELDSAKLSKAFGDNDTAQRLKQTIPQFKEYLKQNEDMFPNKAAQEEALSKLERMLGVADNARLIERARHNPSGTGAAVNRNIDSLRGKKTGFLEGLINNPIDVMQGFSQFKKTHADLFDTQDKLVKAYRWSIENPYPTTKERELAFTKIMKGN